MGSDPDIKFDTYSWATLCAHEMMAQFVKYKFDDHPAMSVDITQFTVCSYQPNPTSKLKVDLGKNKSLPGQFESLSDDLNKFKINQNSTYNMVGNLKDRGSWK